MNTHVQRVVLTYKKADPARWLSHLDLIRMLERAIRRAQSPVTYSQGFNPRPRLSFGPPLPLGATSDAELLAIRLDQPVDPSDLVASLNAQLPPGIEITEARAIPDSEPTMKEISGCSYLLRAVCLSDSPWDVVNSAINVFIAQNEVFSQRVDKRLVKRVNIRPSVESLELVEMDGSVATLRLRVSHKGAQIAKPVEIVEALSQHANELKLVSIHREVFY
jgi:radical SAM-linked protein